jgi:DNA-binding NarL/FixJ family response regulator
VNAPKPKVLLIEDEKTIRRFVRAAVEEEDCAVVEAETMAGGLIEAGVQKPDLLILDLGLPDGNGIDLIRTLHERDPALPILVISTWSTEQVIVAALQAGATGYVLKERDELEISLSIRSALRGGAPIDPFVAKRILELIGKGGSLLAKPVAQAQTQTQTDRGGDVSPLTPREIEILSLVSKGLTNREIADVLALSKLTVGCHIRNIYKKLAVKSRTQAVFEARSYGLLS